MAVRNPFVARRAAPVPAARTVPAPEVMAGMEYLDTPDRRDAPTAVLPEVSIQGIDPQGAGQALVPRMRLVLAPGVSPPESVEELVARRPPGDAVVRRLTFDVRPFRDVLEARGGWNVLAQLVRNPSDRTINATFRASIAGEPAGSVPSSVIDGGDLDVDVCVVADGDTVAARCRRELGRARLALTPFLADSERLARLLAETLRRPRDVAGRRCLEHGLADLVVAAPLTALLHLRRDAPSGAVPGARPGTSAPPTV